MLWTVYIVLLVVWLLGVIGDFTLGGFIHILLDLAVVTLIVQLIGRSKASVVSR